MAARLNTVRVLWMSLTVTNVFFLLVLRLTPATTGAPPHLAALVAAIALGITIMSIVMPARGFDMALRNTKFNIIEAPGEVIGGFRESAPVTRIIAEPEEAMKAALAPFQTPFLLGMALAEAVSLFGFMLGHMGARPIIYMPFFGVGTALMLSKLPTEEKIRKAIERVTNAKFLNVR